MNADRKQHFAGNPVGADRSPGAEERERPDQGCLMIAHNLRESARGVDTSVNAARTSACATSAHSPGNRRNVACFEGAKRVYGPALRGDPEGEVGCGFLG